MRKVVLRTEFDFRSNVPGSSEPHFGVMFTVEALPSLDARTGCMLDTVILVGELPAEEAAVRVEAGQVIYYEQAVIWAKGVAP